MPVNELATVAAAPSWVMSFDQMERLAERIAKSGLFGLRTVDQALSLMAIAQAEGKHPALAARDYDIIQGRPAKRAEAMMRDYFAGGGRVQWHELSDEVADATFTHPIGGEARIRWDTARVKRAGLSAREGHAKYPRQMLRSRVVSEGVRTIWPVATGGLHVPEEIDDMPRREPIDVTPAEPVDTAADLDAFAAEPMVDEEGLHQRAEAVAREGTEALRGFWERLAGSERRALQALMPTYKDVAAEADGRARDDDPFGLPPVGEAHPPEPVSEARGTQINDAQDADIKSANAQPAVPLAAAARALVPVAGDDGELGWRAWSDAFVALIQTATAGEARKCRLSELPHYGRCRSEDGDAAAAVQAALNAKSREVPPP